ncbi:MAG TPA: right-handed parallel beta-helix repeat-containing protein [Polyangia bacterium]|nr:right-handed parallel beta-helix repeat-containing protein [Polyangia bacterium]
MNGRLLLATLLLLGTAGCWQYRAGYCDHSHPDCGPGYSCDLTSHKCASLADASGGGGGGGNGGAGGRDAGRDVGTDTGPAHCVVDARDCGGLTPFCDGIALTCRGCKSDDECMALDAGKPACLIAADGGTIGVCVACTANKHCPGTAPVCDGRTNSCQGCVADDDCKLHAPGVCNTAPPASADAAVAPSRCLRDDEAIYVSKTTGCSDLPPPVAPADAGTLDAGVTSGISTRPFCSMEPVRGALSAARHVVVVSGSVSGASWPYEDQAGVPISIVGKSATIGGAASPAFQMSSGDVTIRSVSFSTVSAVGIQADGGTLRLDRVTVDHCPGGGIWLNGANFDIRNTRVSNSGPGDHDGASWGGILETGVPATGPRNISQVTVISNTGQGITCKDPLTGGAVLAAMNQPIQISPGCTLTVCADAGAMCGAQP